jgi:hypothetical protein
MQDTIILTVGDYKPANIQCPNVSEKQHFLKIQNDQLFKIEVEYWNGICRDEFESVGQIEFDRLFVFAKKIASGYDGSKIIVIVQAKN